MFLSLIGITFTSHIRALTIQTRGTNDARDMALIHSKTRWYQQGVTYVLNISQNIPGEGTMLIGLACCWKCPLILNQILVQLNRCICYIDFPILYVMRSSMQRLKRPNDKGQHNTHLLQLTGSFKWHFQVRTRNRVHTEYDSKPPQWMTWKTLVKDSLCLYMVSSSTLYM